MDYIEFYKKITNLSPYLYQEKVAKLLLNGKNVILSVPTGAGKTLATIIPFLFAKVIEKQDFPQKLIYSLPLRTLANSIYSDITKLIEEHQEFKGIASLQTGEYNDDKYFEKDLIFSTIDQTLSNFLCFPLPLSHSQANINAGALIGSYLVFDEFHLLEPQLSMATTIGTLKKLGEFSRFCIMTATLSNEFIDLLKNEKDLNIETVDLKDYPEDIPNIQSLIKPENKEFKKEIQYFEHTLDANIIIREHKQKTIVICNRVESAQRIFLEVKKLKKENTELFCIHSRFFDKDRKEKEQKIKELFGKNSKSNAILISTQVIEAGMDISCEVMHTEISEINSFLQRAGRCARFAGEYGKIFIYDVLKTVEDLVDEKITDDSTEKDEIKLINKPYLPYDEEICLKTIEKLKENTYLTHNLSEKLVNEILTEKEIKIFNSIKSNSDYFNIIKIENSWKDCNKNNYKDTIRNIQSIDIAIINDNQKNNITNPFIYETIGIFRWSFVGWLKKIKQKFDTEDEWIVCKVTDDNRFDFGGSTKYSLEKINEIQYDNPLFVNSEYFHYSSEIGLNLFIGNEISPKKEINKKEEKFDPLKKDTFFKHNKAIINCYKKEFLPKNKFTITNFNKLINNEINIEKLIELMVIFHDYGKLNETWQKPIKEYQKIKSEINQQFSYNINEVLTHTDFDVNNPVDKEIAEKIKLSSKPAHAGIGAYALQNILENNLEIEEEYRNAFCKAILRHHSIDTSTYKPFNIDKNAINEIQKILNEFGFDFQPITNIGREAEIDLDPTNDLLYLFLVRILRICDQKATSDFEKYLKV